MLNKRESFKAIGRFLCKDCTTISKEVKNHICFEKSGAYGRAFNDCRLAFLHQCSARMVCSECSFHKGRFCWSCGKCSSSCILYGTYICPRLPPLMSAMAARNAINVLWKNISIRLLMLKRSMNWSERKPELFYCNASAPYQKGSCENNHEMIPPDHFKGGRYRTIHAGAD